MTPTPNTAALKALLDRVEAGEWWYDLPRPACLHTDLCWKAFNGSLDAAKALHDAVCPNWRPRIELGGFDAFNRHRPHDLWTVVLWYKNASSILALEGPVGTNADPARAWLIAILRALIAAPVAENEGDV